MVSGGGCAHPATYTPFPTSLFSLHSLPTLLSLLLAFPETQDRSGIGPKVSRLVLNRVEATQRQTPRLAEFQTPTIFDCDCDLICSKAYRHSKIVKMIIGTFCMNINVYIILFRTGTII